MPNAEYDEASAQLGTNEAGKFIGFLINLRPRFHPRLRIVLLHQIYRLHYCIIAPAPPQCPSIMFLAVHDGPGNIFGCTVLLA
jgi:hypothetical protein